MRAVASFVFLLASFGSIAGDADSLKTKAVRYVFSVNSGVLFCYDCMYESSTLALPSTIHGIQVQNLRLGAGVGHTSFGPIRTLPYFGSISFDFFGKKSTNGVFMEFDYGGAHTWLGSPEQRGDQLKKVDAWGFSQISVGYAHRYEKLRFAAQLGFMKLKTIRRYRYNDGYYYLDYYIPPYESSTNYEIKRLFVTVSVGI